MVNILMILRLRDSTIASYVFQVDKFGMEAGGGHSKDLKSR
jgi:hypothetical protein